MLVVRLLLALLLAGSVIGRACADAPPTRLAQLAIPTPAPSANDSIDGLYATAPVEIDGRTVLRLAVPADQPANATPVGERANQVETAITEILAETGTGSNAKPLFDPATLRIKTRQVGGAIVLEAIDAKHPTPLPILTVTSVDARANGTDIAALAAQWQITLQGALVRALTERQPAAERRNIDNVAIVLAVLIALSLVVYAALRAVWKRMAEIEAEVDQQSTAAASDAQALDSESTDSERRRLFRTQLRAIKPAERMRSLSAIVEALGYGLALAWVAGITWSLSRFAETTPLAESIAHSTFGVVVTLVVAVCASRLLDTVISRTADAWRLRRIGAAEDRARALLRVPTIARTVSGAKSFGIVFVAVLSILGQIGVPIASVITIGGLTAVALSLAAQNFVRDFINGFLVLLEDQYVVGDFVTINGSSGIVERLTLRMVQIRNAGGDLVTIPHSAVTGVINQSRNWSRVDYHVPIDPSADITRAIAIVREQITLLLRDRNWASGDGEPVEWIGVDTLAKDTVVIRASVRTQPLRQFELRRRINLAVLGALHADGIELGAIPPS